MKRYKSIGIIGGMGPEATAALYSRIIALFQQRLGATLDSDFPEIFIVNAPIPDVVASDTEADSVCERLLAYARTLQNAGAEFIVIPCNTVTKYLPALRQSVCIPVLDIIQEAIDTVPAEERNSIGLLATTSTIENNLYGMRLSTPPIVLSKIEQQATTEIILRRLAGKSVHADARILKRYIERLRMRGATAVILGCTELPLIVRNTKAIDSLATLANAAFRVSTQEVNNEA